MASYSEDLTCSICLTLFTDPVILVCGHSFCRECITLSLSSQHQCPQCRATVPTEGLCLLTSHILKSLSEKAKEAEKVKRERGKEEELCPEHEEKLKLFCVTDQKLVCIICRDGEKHEGHKFKPVKEAAASTKKELETFVDQVLKDIQIMEGNANTQKEEISKTKEKSEQLMIQISSQFEEMHQFLRKREDEIKEELKQKEREDLEKMTKVLNEIELTLSDSKELKEEVTSVLTISDSEQILKSWSDKKKMKDDKCSFKPRGETFKIKYSSLSLGPYESHLQFFMWKEMLHVIQPRAERLKLRSSSREVTVSEDRRSLTFTPVDPRPLGGHFGTSFGTGSSGSIFEHSGTLGHASSGFGSREPGSLGKEFGSLSFGNPGPFGQPSSRAQRTKAFGFQTCEPGSVNSDRPQSRDDAPDPAFSNEAFSVNEFSSGQHYWELDVGQGEAWALGVKGHVLKYDGKKYSAHSPDTSTDLPLTHRLEKVGIYLNSSSQQLWFYDADQMSHVHTLSRVVTAEGASAYFGFPDSKKNLVTVCWYSSSRAAASDVVPRFPSIPRRFAVAPR